MNIRKLHQIYCDQIKDDLYRVSFAMFRRVFVNEFNIGFKLPSSDVCSTCALLDQKIKTLPSGSMERVNLMTQKRIHKLRANAFYAYMKEKTDESVCSLCFDLQQIQQLPKTNIQDAYYLRQLNFYSLCITSLDGKTPTFYTWSEEQAGKGSTEISSALHSHLRTMNLKGIKTLRLFCNGCVAQNKNNINIQMLLHFLYSSNNADIQEIQLYFPVRGHSFLPADRVFGRVEKILRKSVTIISKELYYEIYKNIGAVKIMGVDWELLNTKSLNRFFKNLSYISELKKIFFKKQGLKKIFVKVKGFKNYRFEDGSEQAGEGLLKRGIKVSNVRNITLESLPLNRPISAEEKKDVEKLLKLLYGDGWHSEPDFEWYRKILFDE
nr:uncharacterized protein LOC124807169 [Hydra vulgaris]